MKKHIILALLLTVLALPHALAQGVVTSELEDYAKRHYSSDWSVAATSIFSKNPLVSGAVQYSEVIEMTGKSKAEIYTAMRQWMVSTFTTLKEDNEDAGRIIATDAVKNISERLLGMRNAYRLNINPDVRIDVKDGRVRLSTVIAYYDVDKTGGAAGKALKGIFGSNKLSDNDVWAIKDYYPFTSAKENHCAQAYVMTFCYGPLLAGKLRQYIIRGAGTSNDW